MKKDFSKVKLTRKEQFIEFVANALAIFLLAYFFAKIVIVDWRIIW